MLTIKDMVRHNQSKGRHFFDDATMNFWNSKIESELEDEQYFITSELNFEETERRYTVRKYIWATGDIKDMSDFLEFKTLDKAKEFMEYLTLKEVIF